MVWYPMDTDAKSETVLEHNGQKFHLVDSSKRIAFPNDSFAKMAESVVVSAPDRIQVRLSEATGEQLRTLTSENTRRRLAIIVNGSIRMAPTINDTVGRDIAIHGKFTTEEREFLTGLFGLGQSQVGGTTTRQRPTTPAAKAKSPFDADDPFDAMEDDPFGNGHGSPF